MLRRVLCGLGIALVVAGGVDLGARFVLGRDLVAFAERPPLPAAAPPAPVPKRIETSRYAVSWVVPATCGAAASCVVTITVEPAAGRYLPEAPFGFRANESAALSFDHTTSFSAKERTAARAVVDIPLRVAGTGPHTLEGYVRVYTCKDNLCQHDRQPLAIPLG